MADNSVPPVNNGYGFVCFQSPDAAVNAVQKKNVDSLEIIKYQPKDNREVRKVYNNIYVKNFNPAWNQAKLQEIFGKFGTIKSCVVMKRQNANPKEGEPAEKPFAFICFDKADDKAYGPTCATNAVNDLHDKELDGFKIYVQPAVPQDQR